jgi:aspartate carbamoyltransferase regulatory subunit
MIKQFDEKKEEKIKTNQNLNINAHTICGYCSNKIKIEPLTSIYSKIYSQKIDYKNASKEDYKYIEGNNILLRTINYKCPNDKCETRKKSKKKEAIIYRSNYDIVHKCVVCKTIW